MSGSVPSESTRAASFKKGIVAEEQTQKRADEQVSIRKQKRANKLERKRITVKPDFEGIPDVPQNAEFETLLPRYSVTAFMAGDVAQLRILNMLFGAANSENLERHIHTLIMSPSDKKTPVVIQRLVQGCDILEPKSPEQVSILRMCLSTLYNFTGTPTSFDKSVAQALIHSGFLTIFRRHLEVLAQGKTPFVDIDLRRQAWDIIYNIIVSVFGHEARDTVLADPLFAFPYGDSGNGHNSMFTRELQACRDEALVPTMAGILSACYEHGRALPPWLFILNTWQFLVKILFAIQPIPYDQMDAPAFATVNYITGSILSLFRKMAEPRDNALFLLKQVDLTAFMRKLGQLCEVGNLAIQRRIVETLVEISELKLGQGVFQKAAKESRCTSICFHAINSRDEIMRWRGFLLVGNYMSDGLEYVMDMMDGGVTPIIIARARDDTIAPRRTAIFALMSMFLTCNFERENMTNRKTAEGVMRTLLHKFEMFRWICPLLGLPGQEKMTVDILNVISTSLEWDHELTLEALALGDGEHKVSDTLNRAVNELRGERSNAVFQAASKVEALLNDKEGGGGGGMDMEIDVPVGYVNGVYYGSGFSF